MTIFNWLNEITVKKTNPNNFTQEDWDGWNSYMVHRFLSMNMNYIDIVNFVQKINPQNKKDTAELSKIIANKLSVGNDEAGTYIPLLGKEGVTEVLSDLGYEKKEITKLIKTI